MQTLKIRFISPASWGKIGILISIFDLIFFLIINLFIAVIAEFAITKQFIIYISIMIIVLISIPIIYIIASPLLNLVLQYLYTPSTKAVLVDFRYSDSEYNSNTLRIKELSKNALFALGYVLCAFWGSVGIITFLIYCMIFKQINSSEVFYLGVGSVLFFQIFSAPLLFSRTLANFLIKKLNGIMIVGRFLPWR